MVLKKGWSLVWDSITWKYKGEVSEKEWSQKRGGPWSGVHFHGSMEEKVSEKGFLKEG